MAARISAEQLRTAVGRIFAAAGCESDEAGRIAHYLVEANLVGHDSHGVIRVPPYVSWLTSGKVLAGKSLRVIFENETMAVVDGQFGLGQTIGEQAVDLGVDKAARSGVSVVALRDSGHLGRIGDWPLRAARAGLVSLHFVNTSGAGMLVAPFGGISRRLSACPIAAGVPVANGVPIVLDISMCTIAEGKIKVALNKGITVPEGCMIDAQGRPTTDPRVFYADPPGSILAMGGHKGYGLAIIAEVLAGAMTGGSCTDPAHADRLANGMFSIYFDPEFFSATEAFQGELKRFIEFVKSAAPVVEGGEVLVPGEVEERTRTRRLAEGVELDDTTRRQLAETGRSVGLDEAQLLDFTS